MDITIASGSPPCSVDASPLSRPSWYENAYKSMAEQATEWWEMPTQAEKTTAWLIRSWKPQKFWQKFLGDDWNEDAARFLTLGEVLGTKMKRIYYIIT